MNAVITDIWGDGAQREPGRSPGHFDAPLWRSLAVVRIAALGYATALVAANFDSYDHPAGGWITIAVMVAWTVVTTYRHLRPGWRLLAADLAVTLACLIATRPIVGGEQLEQGTPIIPIAWLAGPALAWAVAGGRRAGAIAGAVLGLAVVAVRGEVSQGALTSLVLLTLIGIAVGHVARLTAIAEAKLQRATELIAANRERDRLARTIHDSVLQVLAMIERRGAKLGGEAAELARMAGEQGTALRTLVAVGSSSPSVPGSCDLAALLGAYASPIVSVITPADPVQVRSYVGSELASAVRSALDNVTEHCPPHTPSWVVVEQDGVTIVVTVRDTGPGIPDGRIDEAKAEGRLGISQSIQGRIHDLGGTVTVTSATGQGTEIEMRVPGAT